MRDRILSSPWLRLTPALALVAVLFGASMAYGVAQSLGVMDVIGQQTASLEAYRRILLGEGATGNEFWISLGFSLWISVASTLISAAGALGLAVWLTGRRTSKRQVDTLALNWNLAFPHLVWAAALLLFLSQSGLLSRWAATLGLIHTPADFPVLVLDRWGVGIILHYVTKEIPFLALIVLAVLLAQPIGYDVIAENLGASRWQRLRHVTIPLVGPALLGVRYPRALPVLALEFFTNPDLRSRAEGMAISLIITVIVLVVAVISLRRGER